MCDPVPMRSALSLLLLSLPLASPQAASPSRPNVVLILVDDLGFSDLGCYGGEIRTPNVDRLAESGLRYTNFTNCAKCESTRASLMSGRYHTEVERGALKDCLPLPRAMQRGGYHTMMVGKWHLGPHPMDVGFDRYFGFLNGASNFFTGEATSGGTHFRLDREAWRVPESGFYCTDAFTDFALRFLDEQAAREQDRDAPFFLYVAYNAPHYPLQAPREEVERYIGKYAAGWDALRSERLERMKRLGIVARDQELSARPDIETFEELDEDQRRHHDLMMATYAAMVDRVDQNVGRLLKKLEELGEAENTLTLFLSDNGACPFQRSEKTSIDQRLAPWDPDSFWCYDQRWAHACNTPWRKYKQNQHEGGVSTPLVAHWPAGLREPGRFERQRGHVVDLYATLLELAASPPAGKAESEGGPLRGISLLPHFSLEERRPHEELFYFFNRKKTALLQGEWKLVDSKELYRLPTDRIEAHDLSKEHPERFEAMKARWAELAREYGAIRGQ